SRSMACTWGASSVSLSWTMGARKACGAWDTAIPWDESGEGLQLGVDGSLGQVVGRGAERSQAGAEDDFQRGLLRIAGVEESLEVVIADLTAVFHDGQGEHRQGIELGIAERLGAPQCLDDVFRHGQLLARDGRVAGDAETAPVTGGGRDLHHFALGPAERG